MAPLSIRSRKLRLTDSDLPCTDRHPSPPCSPEVQQTAFVFQDQGFPKQSRIDNEVWPPIFKPDFLRSAKSMKLRDDDVMVCTYPKCGTTWIQHICSQLMSEHYGPNVGHELCVTSPMIERMGAKFAENLEGPRLLKSHFAWHNLPKSDKAKYIFAVRNPKDCLTSYFFHNCNFKIYDFEHGDFNKFFELFLSNDIAFGNYFRHLNSWLAHSDEDNILLLKYEDMCEDLESAVIKIGHFLGGRAAEMVDDPLTLEQIVHSSTINSMKKDQWRWFPEENLRRNTFIRKGGSGDWRNYLSREQSDKMDRIFRKEMSGTVAENWWIDEMSWDDDEEEEEEVDCLDDDGINMVFESDPEPSEISQTDLLPSSELEPNFSICGSSSVPRLLINDTSEPSEIPSRRTSAVDIQRLGVPVPSGKWLSHYASSLSSQSSGYNSLCSSLSSMQNSFPQFS